MTWALYKMGRQHSASAYLLALQRLQKLARDIAMKIEQDVASFPGEIKVTVLRELRATEYAISGKHRGNGERSAFRYAEPAGEEEPAQA